MFITSVNKHFVLYQEREFSFQHSLAERSKTLPPRGLRIVLKALYHVLVLLTLPQASFGFKLPAPVSDSVYKVFTLP